MEFGLAVIIGLIFLAGAPLGLIAFFKTNAQAKKLDEISGELFKLRNIVSKLEVREEVEDTSSSETETAPVQNLAEESQPDPLCKKTSQLQKTSLPSKTVIPTKSPQQQ